MNLFVEADACVGLLDAADPRHAEAVEALRSLEASRLITSSFVLGEVAARGARLVGARTTARFLRGLWSRESAHVVEVGRDLFLEGLRIQEKDPGLSLTGAISVVLMRAARIKTAFSFDRGFRRLGFRLLP
ncbi:MAG TPA: PIN domain-containing protein [Planctomycetota bacterium]